MDVNPQPKQSGVSGAYECGVAFRREARCTLDEWLAHTEAKDVFSEISGLMVQCIIFIQ